MLQAARDAAAAEEKEQMRWGAEKIGPAMVLSADRLTVSRDAGGWGAQISDTWISKDVTTFALSMESVTEDTCIGIVGRNFNSSPGWDAPLVEHKWAIVLRAGDGKVFHKGRGTSFILKPLESGARLNVVVDMQLREMTYELLGEETENIISSLTVENIPAELALGIKMYASGKTQCILPYIIEVTLIRPTLIHSFLSQGNVCVPAITKRDFVPY